MNKNTGYILIFFLVTMLAATAAYAQEPIVFPAQGQSDEQMDQDKYACYNWAKKESTFDPMAVPTASAPPPKQKETKASTGRGAVGGALLGAGLGKITGGGAKKGAVVGGLGGAVVGGSRKAGTEEENKKANQQWANEQGAEYAQNRNHYNRAFSACMEGKGYTVK
jgi:outer membrane lipoprotein SlyB